MLESVLTETVNTGITMGQFLLCTITSVMLGAVLAAVHTYRNQYSRSFILTLVLLPVMVQTVIMLVNGRSLPGNAREIGSIFLAMALGLAAGMGYLGTAMLLMIVSGGITILLISLPAGRAGRKELKITIPENLDYSGIFDDIFAKYTKKSELVRVRTVNMGSLYELCYQVDLKSEFIEKNMLDEIRCRNGNLTIVCGRLPDGRDEL